MDATQHKAADKDEFGGGQRNAGPISIPFLDDCKDSSVARLRVLLGEALEKIRPELLRMVERAMGQDLYHLYMDTLELVRDHKLEIENAFQRAFLRRFNQAVRRGSKPMAEGVETSRLSLLAPDDLESSLAIGSMASAIRDACIEELFGLDKRVGILLNDPDLLYGANPLGPEVIAGTVMDALDGLDTTLKPRLLLMAQLTKLLPERTREIYGELNHWLVARNVLPTIRVGVRRSEAALPPPSAGQPLNVAQSTVPMGPAMPAAEVGEIFAVLQQLLTGMAGRQTGAGGHAPAPSAGLVGAGSAAPATAMPDMGAVIQSLSQLQRGQAEAITTAGLDSGQLNNGMINVLHTLRSGTMANTMTSLDALTLDVVAMVFDYILEDDRIPDAIKALIGRLQIPMLKVAMLDKNFFSKKAHPARRFLDDLAAAAVGWDASEGHENGLYRKVEELVGRIVEQFEDRVEMFAEAQAELDDFLEMERRKAEQAAEPGIRLIKAREKAELSRLAAQGAVNENLAGHVLPPVISDFLRRYWLQLLADIHNKSGPDSTAWKIALNTMSGLIWSVEPKVDPTDQKTLSTILPTLLKQLEMGIDLLDMPRAERDAFFAELVKCHAAAMKADLIENAVLTQQVEQADIPVVPESIEFEPVDPADQGADKPAAPSERAVARPAARPGRVDRGPRLAPEAELDRLTLGRWIEFTRDDGSTSTARLSWVSPLQGIYLFANRHGQSAVSITTRGLLAKLHSGEVRILDDVPLMDRAVGNLLLRLQNDAA